MTATVDVAVVGAGVIGAAIGWRAAQCGHTVALLDPNPGGGASYAAAGMLAPVSEASYGEEPLLRLCLESARRYPAFLTELAATDAPPVASHTGGTLLVARDDDDLRQLDAIAAYHRELDLPVRRLTGRACRAEEPLLSPRIRGGLAVDGDHAVDPRGLVAALLAAATGAGAAVLRRQVTALLVEGGSARGVRLDTGEELRADVVVLAAGAWSGTPHGIQGLDPWLVPPVRPVKGQVLRLRGAPGPLGLSRIVRGWVHGSPIYAVPYGDGRVVVGATSEDRGFDTTVTAGATAQLLRDALELVPALSELELVEATARVRPGTPDNAPLIGPTALPGLVLATGHYRNGVLLAPVTADAVAAYLSSGSMPAHLAAFDPRRFAATPKEVPA